MSIIDNTNTTAQYLTFNLDKELYALEISKVREVLDFTNVTKVRWRLVSGGADFYINNFTLEAEGYMFIDKGFRIEQTGSATKKIAIETLSGHKVRIRGGDGVTYGVPLVSTASSIASPLRIYDGATVYATADYDLATS